MQSASEGTIEQNKKNTSEKRASPPSDDEEKNPIIDQSDEWQQMNAKGKKKTKTTNENEPERENQDTEIRQIQQSSTNGSNIIEEKTNKINITNQALAYAIENNLPPIKIECSPHLGNRDKAKKFVINLFKSIDKDFREKHPANNQPLGFHHWWTDKEGKNLFGVTNDTQLYIYLCQTEHYPTQVDDIKVKPQPPKRMPPQNTMVIKFVSNELQKNDIEEELKMSFRTVYAVENMMGTMRSKSRHIRVEFYEKNDYSRIINDGKIGLQGQIFEVEEYLPPPKILICSKCNTPGHTRKSCKSENEICRRCGQNRNNNVEHKDCMIKCHHCNGDHVATDYKCSRIIKFRQDLLSSLKNNRDKLPPNIKLFIPVDCRTNGDKNRFLITEINKESTNSVPYNTQTANAWFTNAIPSNANSTSNEIDQTIASLAKELQETKMKHEKEREEMKKTYERQIKSIHQGWCMVYQHAQAQNQYLTLLSASIKENMSALNQIIAASTKINETVKTNCQNETDRNKIEISQKLINTTFNHINSLNETFANQEQSLIQIMNKQTTLWEATIEKMLSSENEQ